jgi:hypothetical protein
VWPTAASTLHGAPGGRGWALESWAWRLAGWACFLALPCSACLRCRPARVPAPVTVIRGIQRPPPHNHSRSGLCHHGSDCNYLHRVPTERDEARHGGDYGHDIFGRERAPESRDGRKRGAPGCAWVVGGWVGGWEGGGA